MMSQHQVSPEMWISAYLHTGISGLEIKKKTRSTKSRITDENREVRLYFLYFLMIPLFLLMLERLGV